ncbi:MAG: BatA domain-containing protein [Phycisphaeraceae bacterium]|nr:BatA domain-containing protein [Phycisphaeraceae bacterium]
MLAQVESMFTTAGLAAAGAAAVAIPVAIHLLTRLRRQRQPWAAMRFLQAAFRRQKRRVQLEQWLLLAARCLIVALLGLALARPLMGSLGAWFGGRDPGRFVQIILDDGLTSQTADRDGATRFDHLRAQALDAIRELRAQDEVAVWRAGTPVELLAAPGGLDRAALAQSLTSLKPRFGRGDVASALAGAVDLASRHAKAGQARMVVVLSDFAAAGLDVEQPTTPAVKSFLTSASLNLTRPMPEAANVQVEAVQPRRRLVVMPEGQGASASISVKLRRFRDDGEGGLVGVRVTARRADDTVIADTTAEHRWSAGQLQATLNLELPFPAATPGGDVVLETSVEPGSVADSLTADNRRWSLLELRRRLIVGVVDEPGTEPNANGEAAGWSRITPGQWLAAALSPRGQLVETMTLAPGVLTSAMLRPVDACFVLRPDLLTEPSMAALADRVDRGGLVWLIVPATELPAVWAPGLMEKLGLPWRVNVAPTEGDAGVALDAPAPGLLSLLSADWQDLLRPVRVTRWLTLSAEPDHPKTTGQTWLSLTGEGRPPLLVSCPRGRGRWMVLTTALDATWTNLPTKPLLVPLLHETLRAAMSEGSVAKGDSEGLCGHPVELGPWWEGATRLTGPAGQSAAIRHDDRGITTAQPLDQPGLYRDAGTLGALAVNVDAAAGDTRSLDTAKLSNWLGESQGQWLDEGAMASALSPHSPRLDIGAPLLWAVLGLMVLETAMARWFSHAKTGQPSLGRWAWMGLRRLLRGTETPAP